MTTKTAPFTKLHHSITRSSIWLEPATTIKVWIAFLTSCDPNGFVKASRRGFQHMCAVSDTEFSVALETLEGPDADSSTPDADGRRVIKVEGGWQVVNYLQFRNRQTEAQVKAAARQKRYRDRKKKSDVALRNVEPEENRLEENRLEESRINTIVKESGIAPVVTVAAAPVANAPRPGPNVQVEEIVQAYCKAYKLTRPASRTKDLGPKARKLIASMLKIYDVQTVIDALDFGAQFALAAGPKSDDHKYFSASTLFRNEANFSRMIEKAENGQGPKQDRINPTLGGQSSDDFLRQNGFG